MALQTFPGFLSVPGIAPTGGITFGNALLLNLPDTAGGFVLKAPIAGDITRIGFRFSTLTAANDNALDMRVETVDMTTGFPTGTLVNAGANVAVADATVDGFQNTWQWFTLGTAATVAKDQDIAVLARENGAGTPLVRLSENIAGFAGQSRYPYAVYHNGTSWAAISQGNAVGIEYSGGVKHYIDETFPGVETTNNQSWSSPRRDGIRFRTTFPTRLSGVRIAADMDNDYVFQVWRTDGSNVTLLYTSPTFDKDLRSATSVGSNGYQIPAADRVAILANTYYRVVFLPSGGAIAWDYIDVDSASDFDGWVGGQDFHYTSSATASPPTLDSDFTQTLTRRPLFSLHFDQFDDGVGGASTVSQHTGVYGPN